MSARALRSPESGRLRLPVIMIGLLSVALPATHATSTVDLAGFALLACDFRVY
jgi:hypothetical protein